MYVYLKRVYVDFYAFPILEKQFVFSCKVETSLVDSELAVIVSFQL